MKLFLDDVRDAPEGFMRAFRPDELSFFRHLARYAKVISMDHDLGLDADGNEFPNGNDILKIFEKEVYEGTLWGNGAPQILVHSANPVGRKNMEDTINSIINKVGLRN
jgi:hypothetical protein